MVLVVWPVGPGHPDGYPERAVDWSDIGGLEIGG